VRRVSALIVGLAVCVGGFLSASSSGGATKSPAASDKGTPVEIVLSGSLRLIEERARTVGPPTGLRRQGRGAHQRTTYAECRSDQISAVAGSFQGATGSQIGGFRVVNHGRPCILDRRISIRRLNHGKRLPFPSFRRAKNHRKVTRLVVARGGRVEVLLQLFNACPGRSAGTLVAAFDHGATLVPLGIRPSGRCDLPNRPPWANVDWLADIQAGYR